MLFVFCGLIFLKMTGVPQRNWTNAESTASLDLNARARRYQCEQNLIRISVAARTLTVSFDYDWLFQAI